MYWPTISLDEDARLEGVAIDERVRAERESRLVSAEPPPNESSKTSRVPALLKNKTWEQIGAEMEAQAELDRQRPIHPANLE